MIKTTREITNRKKKKKKKTNLSPSINTKFNSKFESNFFKSVFGNHDRIKQQQTQTNLPIIIDRTARVIFMAILTLSAFATINAEQQSSLYQNRNDSRQEVSATTTIIKTMRNYIPSKMKSSSDHISFAVYNTNIPKTDYLSSKSGLSIEKSAPQNRWLRHLIERSTNQYNRQLNQAFGSLDKKTASFNGMTITEEEEEKDEAEAANMTTVTRPPPIAAAITNDSSNQININSSKPALYKEPSLILVQASSTSGEQQQQQHTKTITSGGGSEQNQSSLNHEQVQELSAKLDFFRHSITVSVIITIAYTIVFVVGIIGNSFVVAIVCKSPRMRTVTNYFIVNLAFADILVLLFCLPATLVGNLFIRKYYSLNSFGKFHKFVLILLSIFAYLRDFASIRLLDENKQPTFVFSQAFIS